MFACKVILQRGPGWRLLDEDLVNVIQCQSGGSLCSPRKLTHCRGYRSLLYPLPTANSSIKAHMHSAARVPSGTRGLTPNLESAHHNRF